MDGPPWKQTKLSLERPYKDDNGELIPVLLDILPDGEHVYEPKINSTKLLGENLRRIFVERGVDFFDVIQGNNWAERSITADGEKSCALESSSNKVTSTMQPMTTGDLHKMRLEIFPQLFISLGEMSHARDLLVSLLASPQPQLSDVPSTSSNLSATVVSKRPPLVSVQAFNSQLTIGSKDEALRKAANVFRSAADCMDKARAKGERYWVDALKVRRGNWGLIPAPLPFDAASGKGADKTSKDFLISYGLEESSAVFRRKAISRLTSLDTSNNLVFLQRQHTRLRICVIVTDPRPSISHNISDDIDLTTLDGALKDAQQEVVEQEIFSLLVQEAGKLPTASARVSERLIVIDAAQSIELRFELVDAGNLLPKSPDSLYMETCNLIYFALHALLLRRHAFSKARRLETAGLVRPLASIEASHFPHILQPIIDLLQYQVFCDRVQAEIDKMVAALSAAGISSNFRFNPVGETGEQLVQMFDPDCRKSMGGQASLRIDNRHTIRLTFLSPSLLTAHLPQATLTISSIPQLRQLLTDEVESCLLQKICVVGTEICEGTWFVDLNRCIGRWEGCVLNFRIIYGKDFAINCSAFQVHKLTLKQGQLDTYSSGNKSFTLQSWVQHIIQSASLSA